MDFSAAGTTADGAGDRPAPMCLIACALAVGLAFGILAPATEQRGVDGSLVLAGIVNYPAQSPMSAYFLDSWTIIHQIGAVLLRVGLSQSVLNELIFLLPSALLVCAYAMIIYGFGGRLLWSLLGAALCYLANPLAPFFRSPDYTTLGLLWSQATEETFGFWAQVGAVWVVACVAAGRDGLAVFSALVLIAVHPVLGTYMTALLAATLLVGWMFFGLAMRGLFAGLAGGAAVVTVSFLFYLKTRSGFSAAFDQSAYEAYMHAWDAHRNRTMTLADAVRIGVAAAIAIAAFGAFLALARPRRISAALAAVLIVFAAAASTAAYYAIHLVPELLPELFIRAAPGRLLNLQAYISTPLALGLALYLAGRWSEYRTVSAPVRLAIPGTVLVLIAIGGLAYAWPRQHLVLQYMRTVEARIAGEASVEQQQTEAFWRAVRQKGVTGLVLTSRDASEPSIYHGHLSIALTAGGFDFVPYIPQTAAAVAQIVQEGYGVPFSDPPREMWYHGALPADAGRTYWQQLSAEGWRRLSRDLGVVALVAPTDWSVKLPVLLTGPQFTLYAIPSSS